nr:uncharacterized protein LOC112007430 [Quercus suber]
MRWFNGLKAESINSFPELTQAFGFRFATCRRVPQSLASLLSLSMQNGENLKIYSDRYWEMFNEIEGDFDDVAISTFKLGLPAKHGLRKSLIGKPVTNMHQLMDQIGSANLQAINAVLRESVHQVLEKIKNEPFFKRPSKMVGNPERRNHNLYCQYHQDHGHTTEDCRKDANQDMKRSRMEIQPVLGYSDEDKIGTIQPHDDALVVTLRIGEYDVKRVVVD